VARALRSWQRYHQVTKQWSDIAYQEAVDQAGNVWQLRGLSTQSGANGDVVPNQTYGALLLILAPGEQPTPAMVATVQARVAEFRRRFPGGTRVVGHGEIRPEPTQCPGPAVRAALAAGRFNPPRKDTHVDNHVTDARADLAKAVTNLQAARRHLDEAQAGRTVVHAGAVRAEALSAEVLDLLDHLPKS
jgi:hypothetical protein